jgi:predicted HicB family RNase H-like nuclease
MTRSKHGPNPPGMTMLQLDIDPAKKERWKAAAEAAGKTIDEWVIATLNAAARFRITQQPKRK